MTPKPTCCAPSKVRLSVFGESVRIAAERQRATKGSTEGMIKLDGGPFLMGSEDADSVVADGEGPVRKVVVDPFYMDRSAVTNAQFAEFMAVSDYVTESERFGWSFVFHLHLQNHGEDMQHVPGLHWWRKVDGAKWSNPEGPGTDVAGRENHPVVHVSWNDAAAYAQWAGKRLPTEAEWEFAARGGLEQKRFPWGDELTPGGVHLCNVWQGEFPNLNTGEDGFIGTAPVDAYPANGFGLLGITGNTWEWCADWFSPNWHTAASQVNPTGPGEGRRKSMRGGSYLCHASYCNRYRCGARTSNDMDSSTTNMGFRCVRDIG